ncbi:hypothetical protein SUDANB108_02585 [Streptomyces sp. enrichment culture]|uniref:hypothetical protein n=1 Tax=Streptomyces sp. enrichment culture TaxID=1795815 RepID=UPI003F548A0A
MTDLITRALGALLGVLLPPRGRRRRSPVPPLSPSPYCRDGGVGPDVSRPQERLLRGEDNQLVRPYLSAGVTA